MTIEMPKKVEMRWGALSPSIGEQLTNQGLGAYPPEVIEGFQKCADAVTLLHLRSVLTDSESSRARDRLFRELLIKMNDDGIHFFNSETTMMVCPSCGSQVRDCEGCGSSMRTDDPMFPEVWCFEGDHTHPEDECGDQFLEIVLIEIRIDEDPDPPEEVPDDDRDRPEDEDDQGGT